MTLYFTAEGVTLYHDDNLAVLRTFEANSFDSCVTDPPAGIAFMGKNWDSNMGHRDRWIAWLEERMVEALRVLKPGAHATVWSLPRTSHWTATAIENAGFEIRDKIAHVFGSGFPKSHNLGNGWGTALKPAREDWILARKPLQGTVAENVAAWGTGAVNVQACRVGNGTVKINTHSDRDFQWGIGTQGNAAPYESREQAGRWPPHLLLSHAADCNGRCVEGCPVRLMDVQSGQLTSGYMRPGQPRNASLGQGGYMGNFPDTCTLQGTYGDTGGASRFFPQFRPDPPLRTKPICWLCEAPKHDIMSVTNQEVAPCDHANIVVKSSPQSQTIQSNGFAHGNAQEHTPLGFEGNNLSSNGFVSNAVSSLRSTPQTHTPIAQSSAWDSQTESLAQHVRSVGNLCDSCAIAIAQSVVAISQGHAPASLRHLGFMPEHKRQILSRSLVQFVEMLGSTATTPTTASLNWLFGYVSLAIENYTSRASADLSTSLSPTPFLYQSKASRSERNRGLEDRTPQTVNDGRQTPIDNPYQRGDTERVNTHPTVKSIALMRWLVRLVTPCGGVVLDLFLGSGSTGVAALDEGMQFVGIERESEYVELARGRIEAAIALPLFTPPPPAPVAAQGELSL